jgi:hypothetical protein
MKVDCLMQNLVYRETSSDRRFGVEYEVSNNLSKKEIGKIVSQFEKCNGKDKKVKVTSGKEGWAQSISNNFWHVKFDRTCGPLGKQFDFGWEIASYVGQGLKDSYKIANLTRHLKENGAEVNLNCGLHIHVEVADFESVNMGILYARWLKIEDFLISICHPSRKNNLYCMPIRNKFENYRYLFMNTESLDPIELYYFLSPTNIDVHNNHEKRVTLNSVNFATHQLKPHFSRNTIELRLPEFLLDENHVRNWIHLILNFVEVSKRSNFMPKDLNPCNRLSDVLLYLGLSDSSDFCILDKDLHDLKIWVLNKAKYVNKFSSQAKNLLNLATII